MRWATTIKGHLHKVNITEVASAQFSPWIFHFWPYGHLRPEGGIFFNYELLLLPTIWGDFFMFSWRFFWKYYRVLTRSLLDKKVRFFYWNFLPTIFYRLPLSFFACKSSETMRQVLLYLFCGHPVCGPFFRLCYIINFYHCWVLSSRLWSCHLQNISSNLLRFTMDSRKKTAKYTTFCFPI